jgi:hypothetical protein
MNVLNSIIDFGSVDAEKDERLIEYFYSTSVIDEILDYKKSIIIGRKGTGKTAIYKYIAEKNNDFSSKLYFSDYPWRTHDRYKNTIMSERECFVHSWEFFFFIETFKKLILLKPAIKNKKASDAIKKIDKWLKKNWGSSQFSHRETLNPNKTKIAWSLNPQIMGNGLGSITKDIHSSDNLGNTISEYNKKFANILSQIFELIDFNVILLFDELDLAYSPDDENYKGRLIGLLLASYSFSQQYDKLRIYVFLRNDIFNILEFQDKRKLKDSIVQFLEWDPENVESNLSLKQLVSNRIKTNINSISDNYERNWNEIFEIKNIGRNQIKWNFFVERSFIRPRDIIKLMNLSLDQAKLRLKNDPNTIDKIINDDIHEIRDTYSRYLFDELKDEVMTKYPNYNIYFEILRDIHHLSFVMDSFVNSYNNLKSRFPQIENYEIILERLFEFSIIGFYKPGGGGKGGSEYCFQYSSELQPFNPKAAMFRVHVGFKEHLELLE